MSVEPTLREGRPQDLRPSFELLSRALQAAAQERGVVRNGGIDSEELEARWRAERPLLEFISAQSGCWWVCEEGGELRGYARVAAFGGMEELTELAVAPDHRGRGLGRLLLERCWSKPPSPDLGRVVVTVGTPVDLTLYTSFGVMPVTGRWHLRHRADDYLQRRAQEVDALEPHVHLLTPERAVAGWKRLEPGAIRHERPLLHEFFGRTRVCLAQLDEGTGEPRSLCWVSPEGEIGPAVGRTAEDLVPVVLAALDRVAKGRHPEELGLYCTTHAWWLLDRLRRLGFQVHWPSWVMCSVPLPGLDRYLPTRPPRLL